MLEVGGPESCAGLCYVRYLFMPMTCIIFEYYMLNSEMKGKNSDIDNKFRLLASPHLQVSVVIVPGGYNLGRG